MLTRMNYSSSISKETIFPKIIKTTTHHSIQSIHHKTSSFCINSNLIKLSRHRLLELHCIRSFSNNVNKKLKTQALESRTHNPGVPQFFRNYGFNAHPVKIAICGCLGGLCGAMCGVGGGIVMIPLLRQITTMTAHQIAGTRYNYEEMKLI